MAPATNSLNNKPVLIAGPTGVGKTDFAVALAQRVGGEIVCADAFQLYRGLPLLTAQPSTEQQQDIPHHLFHCIDSSENCDVARWLELAKDAVGAITARNKIPVLVGGTGLYMKAFTHGLDPVPPSDPRLREELGVLPLLELQERLREADPEAYEEIERQNPRRVIRALEIVLLSGRPLSAFRSRWKGKGIPHTGMFLTRDREQLRDRIAANVRRQFASGLVEEVRAARAGNISPTASRAIGFREVAALLEGQISQEECLQRIIVSTQQYAKRQLTWFRSQSTFEELSLNSSPNASTSFESALLAAERLLSSPANP